jgi:alkylation response protein AidB-like acyl-CoA dehydrogenase
MRPACTSCSVGQFGVGARQVHRACPTGGRVRPRHAVLDGEVHLKCAGPAAEMPVGACNSWWQPIAENTGDGLRREVEHRHIGGWQLAGQIYEGTNQIQCVVMARALLA